MAYSYSLVPFHLNEVQADASEVFTCRYIMLPPQNHSWNSLINIQISLLHYREADMNIFRSKSSENEGIRQHDEDKQTSMIGQRRALGDITNVYGGGCPGDGVVKKMMSWTQGNFDEISFCVSSLFLPSCAPTRCRHYQNTCFLLS